MWLQLSIQPSASHESRTCVEPIEVVLSIYLSLGILLDLICHSVSPQIASFGME